MKIFQQLLEMIKINSIGYGQFNCRSQVVVAIDLVLEIKYIFWCNFKICYVISICGNCYEVFCYFFFIVCGFQEL